jgi:hypothetical protein
VERNVWKKGRAHSNWMQQRRGLHRGYSERSQAAMYS